LTGYGGMVYFENQIEGNPKQERRLIMTIGDEIKIKVDEFEKALRENRKALLFKDTAQEEILFWADHYETMAQLELFKAQQIVDGIKSVKIDYKAELIHAKD
tara:strand:+ start:327 stop:632 length:306 start_codon:yes stop_codon:yes gene_type:complete